MVSTVQASGPSVDGRAGRRRVTAATRTALLAAAFVAANAAPCPVLAESLADAWRIALATDLSLAAAAARSDAAAADIDAARSARLPAVTAAAEVSSWRDPPAFDLGPGLPGTLPLFSGDSVTMSEARVTLPVYTAGAIAANIAAAEAGLATSTDAAAMLAQDRKLAVAEAYVNVLRASSALEAAQAERASRAAHARDVDDMLATGQVARNDSLAASVTLADAEQRELDMASALEIARATYNRALGRPLATPFSLEPGLPPVAALGTAAADDLAGMALESRRELTALDSVAAALTARAKAARAERRPQLVLRGGYTALENEVLNREDFWSIGLGVQVGLFDGGRSRGTSSALELRAEAARQERGDLTTLIGLDVHTASVALGAARARIGITETAVVQAEENLRVVRDRYRNGEGTNTEVLDAEALLALSRANYDDARFAAAIAEYRLGRAVGVL